MSSAVIVIRTCLELVALWAFWHFIWKRYSVDLLRQSLFPVRNRLFDMALHREMGFDFDAPAYGALRNSFNSRIRFAHRITFAHVWLTFVIGKFEGMDMDIKSFKPPVQRQIEAIENAALREKLLKLQAEGDMLFLRHLFLTSPLLWIIFAVVLWFVFCRFFITTSFISAPKRAYEFVRARSLADSKYVVSLQADCGEAILQG